MFLFSFAWHIWDNYEHAIVNSESQASFAERVLWVADKINKEELCVLLSIACLNSSGGIGAVARDSEGHVLWAAVRRIPMGWDVETVEVVAARFGCQVARRLGLQRVWLEGDALTVINTINGSSHACLCFCIPEMNSIGGILVLLPNILPQCSDNQTFKVEYKLKRFKTLPLRDKGEKILNKKVEKQKVVGKGKQKVVGKGKEKAKSDEFPKNIKAERFCFSDSLRSRMSPSSVVSVVEDCSDALLKSIRQMGFGSLEYLKVTHLPLHLGLWLVQHFDAKTSSLCIPDYEPFRITEQHVHEVFGFPLGGQDIKDATTYPSVVRRWKKQFKRNPICVKLGELASYLKNRKSGGPMFKRNFAVLCVSTLMSGGQNMNVNYSIMRYLGETDKIRYLNWSKYILDHLMTNKIDWDKRPTRYFPGSLVFLMLLYVDRFVIEEVRAQREIPILKGWTTNMLSTREKLEFFKGRIESFGNSQLVAVYSGSKKPKMGHALLIVALKRRENALHWQHSSKNISRQSTHHFHAQHLEHIHQTQYKGGPRDKKIYHDLFLQNLPQSSTVGTNLQADVF
uniref:RNase H type-1 domain-containing protein n=1 Tax=Chenopodium quinoa TaxID=63459 RepID=A0A803MLV0_CHEQI